MKTLHQIDFPLQMTLLIGSALSMLIDPAFGFFGFFFGIGGWQALMALAFAFDDREFRDSGRIVYERILLTVIGIGIISAFFPGALLSFGFLMLFIGAIMAIWNMNIAYSEYQLAKSNHQVWDID